jgi:uncharacterized SAM-binding protein YcdF (DUF218 family)
VIYLHKILPFFILPLGLTFIIFIAGIVFRRRLFWFVGLALLLSSAMPVNSDLLMRAVEGRRVRLTSKTAPEADAIVVLSGGMKWIPNGSQQGEWNDPDRFLGGIELYKAGKASIIVFTGGWVQWQPELEPEGNMLIRDAIKIGVNPAHMLTTGKVSNTETEAKAVFELLYTKLRDISRPRILLVTSAYHMRRAVMLFKRSGFDVIPFPVDFQISKEKNLSILDFIPNGNSLRQTEIALREVYGYMYYLIRG